MHKRPKAIDLFSGCGGLSLGLRCAGFNVIAAIEKDPLAVSTYKKNHSDTLILPVDIRTINPEILKERLGIRIEELDLLAGCPPCQGFSSLRTLNGSRNIVDPMNELVLEFLRFVRAFKPKCVMMENVPALLKDSRLQHIQKELSDLGYLSEAKVVNAADFGVPQRRLRMVLICSRIGRPIFSQPLQGRQTVAAAIGRLPSPQKSSDPVHNYNVRRAEHVVSLIRRIPKNGGSRTDLPEKDQLNCHKKFDGFKDIYGRMAWDKPAPTITGGCINPSKGRFLHPQSDRAITLREAAILQSFPESYKFDMSRGRYPAAQLIGNAFPPKFAECQARSIYDQICSFTSA